MLGATSTIFIGIPVDADTDDVVVVVVPVAEHALTVLQVCVQVEVIVERPETVVGKQKSVQCGAIVAEQEELSEDLLVVFVFSEGWGSLFGGSSFGGSPETLPGRGGKFAAGG